MRMSEVFSRGEKILLPLRSISQLDKFFEIKDANDLVLACDLTERTANAFVLAVNNYDSMADRLKKAVGIIEECRPYVEKQCHFLFLARIDAFLAEGQPKETPNLAEKEE